MGETVEGQGLQAGSEDRHRRPRGGSRGPAAAASVALAGCGPIQRAQHAAYAKDRMALAKVEIAACVEKRKAGELKTHVESATCINEAQRRGFADIGYRYMDLQSALSAARLRIAAQLDALQINETEAQTRMIERIAEIQNEERRRNEEAAVRNVAIRANDAATTAAYTNMIATGVGMMTGGR